jgi:HlyD family secretion protein
MAKKKSATKRVLVILGVLIVVALLLIIGLRASGIVGGQERATQVELAEVELRTVTQLVTASGNIQPEVEVTISPDVSGEIVTLPVKEGDRVMRGQLLARIEPDFYQAQFNQAEAQVAQARANEAQRRADMLNAQLELNRQKALFESGAISESAFQTTETRYQTLTAAHDASQYAIRVQEEAVNAAREQLSRTTIYAPMDGTISILSVELGERVVGTTQMTGTEMMRVAKLDQMEMEVNVNENDVVNVAVGDTSAIEIDAYPSRIFRGIVTEIANSARVTGMGSQEQITNFPVKIRILDPHNVSFDASGVDDVVMDNELPVASTKMPNFRPGMSGTVDIFSHTVQGATAVPIQAVTVRDFMQLDEEHGGIADSLRVQGEEDLRRVVFIVDEDSRSRIVEVETGIADDSHYVILSGVSVGDQVVTGPYRAVSRTLEPDELVEEQESPSSSRMARN